MGLMGDLLQNFEASGSREGTMEFWDTGSAPKKKVAVVGADEAVEMVARDAAGELIEQFEARADLARERDRFGETPLMAAIRLRRWDCAKACAPWSDWAAQTPRGATSLAALASKMEPLEERALRVLAAQAMRQGADPDERGFDGVSAREASAAQGASWAQSVWGEPKARQSEGPETSAPPERGALAETAARESLSKLADRMARARQEQAGQTPRAPKV